MNQVTCSPCLLHDCDRDRLQLRTGGGDPGGCHVQERTLNYKTEKIKRKTGSQDGWPPSCCQAPPLPQLGPHREVQRGGFGSDRQSF